MTKTFWQETAAQLEGAHVATTNVVGSNLLQSRADTQKEKGLIKHFALEICVYGSFISL